MLPEDKKFVEDIKHISTEELEQKKVCGHYSELHARLVDAELRLREMKEQKERFSQMLGATENTAGSTKRLVKATWGLFWATILMAVLTLLMK